MPITVLCNFLGVTNSKIYKGKQHKICMKRQIYDLTDQPLIMFADRVGKVLRDNDIQHNIVGGVAAQAYILKMMTDVYGKNVTEIAADPSIRIQDYIRSTDDIDMALGLTGDDESKIKLINQKILPALPHESISPDQESIIEFREERRGASRPLYRVYVDDKGSQEDVIALNISRGQTKDMHRLDPKWYNAFLEQGQDLTIPYSEGYNLTVRVPRLEHVLASKIAHSRSKDLMDNRNLATLTKEADVELDFNEIATILTPMFEDEYSAFTFSEFPEEMDKVGRED